MFKTQFKACLNYVLNIKRYLRKLRNALFSVKFKYSLLKKLKNFCIAIRFCAELNRRSLLITVIKILNSTL